MRILVDGYAAGVTAVTVAHRNFSKQISRHRAGHDAISGPLNSAVTQLSSTPRFCASSAPEASTSEP
jgi:hypothetical protein